MLGSLHPKNPKKKLKLFRGGTQPYKKIPAITSILELDSIQSRVRVLVLDTGTTILVVPKSLLLP
jgi:hypothetical protein